MGSQVRVKAACTTGMHYCSCAQRHNVIELRTTQAFLVLHIFSFPITEHASLPHVPKAFLVLHIFTFPITEHASLPHVPRNTHSLFCMSLPFRLLSMHHCHMCPGINIPVAEELGLQVSRGVYTEWVPLCRRLHHLGTM
jgi:hypothetical protein